MPFDQQKTNKNIQFGMNYADITPAQSKIGIGKQMAPTHNDFIIERTSCKLRALCAQIIAQSEAHRLCAPLTIAHFDFTILSFAVY